jgi:hypothetical protein
MKGPPTGRPQGADLALLLSASLWKGTWMTCEVEDNWQMFSNELRFKFALRLERPG